MNKIDKLKAVLETFLALEINGAILKCTKNSAKKRVHFPEILTQNTVWRAEHFKLQIFG